MLARSARATDEQAGAGLARFLERHAVSGASRVVVFVPPTPGPWLERVIAAAASRASARRISGIDFVVCADGIERSPKRSWLARVALTATAAKRASVGPAPTAELAKVVRSLGAARSHVLVVDRKAGRVYAEGHQRALDAA
jgi:hypothetical protein